MPQTVPASFPPASRTPDASLAQERRNILRREESAQQHLGRGAVENDALPNRRRFLKLRICVEKGARDLARERADQRLQIDALHQSFRVATLGRRRELRRASERPAPIGRKEDDQRDRAANEDAHGAHPTEQGRPRHVRVWRCGLTVSREAIQLSFIAILLLIGGIGRIGRPSRD